MSTDDWLAGEPTASVPQFGSPEWAALPVDDPRRMRAVWIAARCWDAYWQPDAIAARLVDELALVDREVRRRFREMSWDLSAGADWRAVADQPTAAELARRRAVVDDGPCGSPRCRGCSRCIRAAAVARQGGDYPGRGVA